MYAKFTNKENENPQAKPAARQASHTRKATGFMGSPTPSIGHPNPFMKSARNSPGARGSGCKAKANSNKTILDRSHIKMLKKWLGLKGGIKCRRLYQAGKHGFTPAEFHRRCDNRGPTITLIKTTTGKIFGGYTDQPWNKSDKLFVSNDSFIFSVSNNKRAVVIDAQNVIGCFANHLAHFKGAFELEYGCHMKESGVIPNSENIYVNCKNPVALLLGASDDE